MPCSALDLFQESDLRAVLPYLKTYCPEILALYWLHRLLEVTRFRLTELASQWGLILANLDGCSETDFRLETIWLIRPHKRGYYPGVSKMAVPGLFSYHIAEDLCYLYCWFKPLPGKARNTVPGMYHQIMLKHLVPSWERGHKPSLSAPRHICSKMNPRCKYFTEDGHIHSVELCPFHKNGEKSIFEGEFLFFKQVLWDI